MVFSPGGEIASGCKITWNISSENGFFNQNSADGCAAEYTTTIAKPGTYTISAYINVSGKLITATKVVYVI